jgi:hypothetical protein
MSTRSGNVRTGSYGAQVEDVGEYYEVPLDPDTERDWQVGETMSVLRLSGMHYVVTEVHDDHLVVQERAGRPAPQQQPSKRRRLWRYAVWTIAGLVAVKVAPSLFSLALALPLLASVK